MILQLYHLAFLLKLMNLTFPQQLPGLFSLNEWCFHPVRWRDDTCLREVKAINHLMYFKTHL